ncbi:MAG TPA: biotin/lipoyl-containing protein, partial [Hyphomicrobium sp.]|nr:biotin/lipoyl-containing protein [Hyphomicrobium sp.]
MATEIRVPALGESVTEAIVGKWLKSAGDSVSADEHVVELETDKVTVEVNAPASGVLGEIKAPEGTTVAVGALLGAISNGAGLEVAKPAQPAPASLPQAPVAQAAPPPAPARAAPAPAPAEKGNGEMPPSPAARKKL